MNAPLVLRDFQGVIEVTPDAQELKSKAIAAAKPITKVESPAEQLVAVAALRDLKAIRTGMEATRKSVKAPVIDLGRRIDNIAYGFLQECDREEARLQGLIAHYQRKQAEAKAKRDAKLESTIKEAGELATEAQELRNRAALERDNDSRAAMLQRAAELDKRVLDAKLTAEITVIPDPIKARGLVVRRRINFQVIDPVVFCQAYPQFWKALPNGDHANELLRVDRIAILDELNREDGKGLFHKTKFPEELSKTEDRQLVQPAGLRVYAETRTHVR